MILLKQLTKIVCFPDKETVNKSTCNESASQRGPHQNVISFSFYGKPENSRGYFPVHFCQNYYSQWQNKLHIISQGIDKNAQVLKKFYPGWVMRVYHDVSPSDAPTTAKLNQLTEQHKDILDTCYVGDLPHYGNMLGKHGHPSDSLIFKTK